jgi:hypothetical protein
VLLCKPEVTRRESHFGEFFHGESSLKKPFIPRFFQDRHFATSPKGIMADEQIEKGVPPRDDAPSPADSVKDDEHNFRLLIVANRLPITIKKQPGVISFTEAVC